MKRSRGGGFGGAGGTGGGGAASGGTGAAAARALEPSLAANPAESDGWFSVSRAAQLLSMPLPRIFDAIRDGKLQVRFEPGKPGESDKPQVTSPELRQKAALPDLSATPTPTSAASSPNAANAPNAPSAATSRALSAAPSMPSPPPTEALLEESRRAVTRLEAEAKESRATFEALEAQVDAALKAVYERDVRIARLESEVATNVKLREGADGFIRHLESRLDKNEERSEEKEKEIRRLAVGLGEARGEIRLLKPPDAPPPSAWRRHGRDALVFLVAVAVGGVVGYFAYKLSNSKLTLEASVAAGAGALASWIAATLVERLRRAKG